MRFFFLVGCYAVLKKNFPRISLNILFVRLEPLWNTNKVRNLIFTSCSFYSLFSFRSSIFIRFFFCVVCLVAFLLWRLCPFRARAPWDSSNFVWCTNRLKIALTKWYKDQEWTLRKLSHFIEFLQTKTQSCSFNFVRIVLDSARCRWIYPVV